MKRLLKQILALGTGPATPLELRVPYRVANLLLLIMAVLSALWCVFSVTVFYVPVVAIVNLLNTLGYSLALLFIALAFPNAGRFLGIAVGTASYCFFVSTVRPNLTGVEFFLVGLLAVPLVIFARTERRKTMLSLFAIVLASALAFYISQSWDGLFQVGRQEATAAYYLTVLSLSAIIGFAIWYFNFGYVESFVQLEQEREKTASLLANTLPQLIVERLNKGEEIIADSHAEAVVLFADMVGFSDLVGRLAPRHVVELLNDLFTRFDRLVEARGVEKIKTIGDCYMAVGGLFAHNSSTAADVVEVALEMRAAARELGRATDFPVDLRIGVATGQVISGVIGRNRMAFDIWGQTVNLASRMESTGKVGSIQVSESTYWRLRDQYQFDKRENLTLKEGTTVTSYYLVGRKKNVETGQFARSGTGGQ